MMKTDVKLFYSFLEGCSVKYDTTNYYENIAYLIDDIGNAIAYLEFNKESLKIDEVIYINDTDRMITTKAIADAIWYKLYEAKPLSDDKMDAINNIETHQIYEL